MSHSAYKKGGNIGGVCVVKIVEQSKEVYKVPKKTMNGFRERVGHKY